MISNNTLIDETTMAVGTALSEYDNSGAMIYIIIVLLWYSVGIMFMLGMQMRARTEVIEDTARRRTKLLIRNLRDHTNTKEILEELVDKQKRARLWDIYLGTTNNPKEKLTRAEIVRIRHIEKRLADIKRDRRLTNETLFPSEKDVRYFRSRSDSRQIPQEVSTVHTVPTLRRRSSFDQQTLERYKALANQSKTHEQVPWNIRKLIIRGYFRRHTKKPPLPIIHQESYSSSDTIIPSANPIPTLPRHRSELNIDEISTINERQNPYLSYFYASSDHPNIPTQPIE